MKGVINMMKKRTCKRFISIMLVLSLMLAVASPAMATTLTLDKTKDKIEKALLQTNVANFNASKNVKVQVEKGTDRYVYSIRNRAAENFPLQMGAGNYNVTFLENVSGNQFRVVGKDSVTLENKSTTIAFLNSIQIVDWQTTMKAIAQARELTKDLKTENEKFNVLYDYMTKNFVYDHAKVSTLTSDYLPDIEVIFAAKKGICYDYSALFGSMLRSSGIPAKLVMGYTTYLTEYHAWNEVFLDGAWKNVDTTADAAFVAANKKVENKFKPANQMKKSKEY